MKELKYVGKEKVRLLGPQIVTGKAKYAESTVEVAFKGTVESLATNSTTKGEILKSSLIGITQWGTPELKTLRLEDVPVHIFLRLSESRRCGSLHLFLSLLQGSFSFPVLVPDLRRYRSLHFFPVPATLLHQ